MFQKEVFALLSVYFVVDILYILKYLGKQDDDKNNLVFK